MPAVGDCYMQLLTTDYTTPECLLFNVEKNTTFYGSGIQNATAHGRKNTKCERGGFYSDLQHSVLWFTWL